MKTLVIVGPTASGKSALAMELAEEVFEIVSADSVQVYRFMDIGSCKPERESLERIRHHLIDIVDPDNQFTAGEFCIRAGIACDSIIRNKKIPLITGGTGLYISSYFNGISEIPEIDRSVKALLSAEVETCGLESLFNELLSVDPGYAARIHRNDRQRIVRGLEVFRGTGKPLSAFHKAGRKEVHDEVLFIGICLEKGILYRRINERVDDMMSKGLVDEVAALRNMGYSPSLNSMRSIGYAEINDYLDGMLSLDDAVQSIKTNTRKYAKKQMTWFKKMKNVIWLEAGETKTIKEKIKIWLNQ